MTKKSTWEARCAELEEVLRSASAAFEVIPTRAIRQGFTWLPSEEALALIEKAKDRIEHHRRHHPEV